MTSPFSFGRIVSGRSFTDREEIMKLLKSNLSSSLSTILISPRRWGKSSLIKKYMDETFIPNQQYRVIMIDLFSIRTEEEFLELYAKEVIKASSGKLEEIIQNTKTFLKNIVPKITLAPDTAGGDISLSFNISEVSEHRHEILDLPEKIASRKKIKFLICIDEFQNLSQYGQPKELLKELRSRWQTHSLTTYCLYGSKRHMMSHIFHNQNSPFYRFGTVLFLEKIDRQHWVDFIGDSFQRTGKDIPSALCGRIADHMKNHPYYVQQLSHIIWTLTEKIVTEEIFHTGIDQLINTNRPFFTREFEGFSPSQINLLRALCNGETSLNSASILQKYKLGTSGNVSKNKKRLEENDIIDITSSSLTILDPVFELWLNNYIFQG